MESVQQLPAANMTEYLTRPPARMALTSLQLCRTFTKPLTPLEASRYDAFGPTNGLLRPAISISVLAHSLSKFPKLAERVTRGSN
jgi:hypothetical protein